MWLEKHEATLGDAQMTRIKINDNQNISIKELIAQKDFFLGRPMQTAYGQSLIKSDFKPRLQFSEHQSD